MRRFISTAYCGSKTTFLFNKDEVTMTKADVGLYKQFSHMKLEVPLLKSGQNKKKDTPEILALRRQ